MSGPDAPGAPVGGAADEFETIARLLRPLTGGAPEALNLADDAAVIPSRPGFDLVVSKDALVCGVHFLPDDPLDLVARKLLRVNLSDLAAKAAEPYGYFLAVAWPENTGWPERERFAAGLAKDQDLFGLRLFGGDTVATPGPLTLSVTIIGWVPQGRMVRRSGAQPGDHLLVSGEIDDGEDPFVLRLEIAFPVRLVHEISDVVIPGARIFRVGELGADDQEPVFVGEAFPACAVVVGVPVHAVKHEHDGTPRRPIRRTIAVNRERRGRSPRRLLHLINGLAHGKLPRESDGSRQKKQH